MPVLAMTSLTVVPVLIPLIPPPASSTTGDTVAETASGEGSDTLLNIENITGGSADDQITANTDSNTLKVVKQDNSLAVAPMTISMAAMEMTSSIPVLAMTSLTVVPALIPLISPLRFPPP